MTDDVDPIQGEYLPGTLSAKYQAGRTTSTVKRLSDMVRERGITRGTIGLRIARKIDKMAYHDQVLQIAGAELVVKDPAQKEH